MAEPVAPVLSVATTVSVRPAAAAVCSRPELEIVSPALPSRPQVTG
jgi:hypothetical protein